MEEGKEQGTRAGGPEDRRAELRTEWIESLTSWPVDKLTRWQGRQVAERGPEDRRAGVETD